MRPSRTVGLTAMMLAALASVAQADWNPGDSHKMHYPQLPDPTGMDVDFRAVAGAPLRQIGDDWRCSETGPVSDIHFWYSFRNDFASGTPLTAITQVNVEIYSDVPGPAFSQPGQLLWSRSFAAAQFTARPYGTGQQSWFDPTFGQFTANDHNQFFQINIANISDPFIQNVGTIYWLVLQVVVPNSDVAAGWKSSGSPQFNDTAVFRNANGGWSPMFDPRSPTAAVPMDLAFVITPTPGTGALLVLGGLFAGRRRR